MSLVKVLLLFSSLLLFLPSQVKGTTALPLAKWPASDALIYSYNTQVKLSNRVSAGKDKNVVLAKFAVTVSLIKVARLTDEGVLLELRLSEPFVGAEALPGPVPSHPSFLVWRRGAVESLFVPQKETTFWTNHYKGVASLITSRASVGEVREVDASGECFVTYSFGEALQSFSTILRQKRRCSPLDLTGEVASRDELREVRRARKSSTKLAFNEDRLQSAHAKEVVTSGVSSTGQEVLVEMEQVIEYKTLSKQTVRELQTEESEDKAVARLAPGKTMRTVGLASEEEGEAPASEEDLRAVIENHREALRHDQSASMPAVVGFRVLLAMTRRVRDTRILAKILADDELADVTPVLADAYIACGTGPCLQAALDWVALRNVDRVDESERLLLGLSLLADPDEATLKRLLKEARAMQTPKEGQEGVRAQLWSTMGSLIGRFALTAVGRYAAITADATAYLIERLRKATTEDDMLAALNALANVRSSEPVTACLEVLANAKVSGRVRCAAISTIEALDVPSELRGGARIRALRTFQSRPFFVDVAARLCGLDFLLGLHPTVSQLISAGKVTRDDAHLRHAFIDRVKAWAQRERRQDAWEILQKRLPGLFRYPGPKGQPPVLEETEFAPGAHLGLSLTTGADGAVRRSDTKAHLTLADGTLFPLYQLAIFTDGLGSVSSGGEGSNEDITAGLSLRLFDASLRPIRFFSGYSGLMSAVWNAPSSLTPFLQVNMAFLEASHRILLQNGLSVRFSCSGLASIDLSGLVSISMWTQRADTQLISQAAVELSISARLATSQFSMQLLHRASTVASMEFNTHVAFSATPPTMCLLATRPDTIVEVKQKRRVKLKGTKPIGQVKHETKVIPGITMSLGRANERACAKMIE